MDETEWVEGLPGLGPLISRDTIFEKEVAHLSLHS